MQRRAIRDAKTPDKMKKSMSVKEDSNLSLQEKKEKIKTGLRKLTELGIANPANKYQELINDIAKVFESLSVNYVFRVLALLCVYFPQVEEMVEISQGTK